MSKHKRDEHHGESQPLGPVGVGEEAGGRLEREPDYEEPPRLQLDVSEVGEAAPSQDGDREGKKEDDREP